MKNPAEKRLSAIVKLYTSVVGRLPDVGGLQHYFESSYSIAELRRAFETSDEKADLHKAVDHVRELLARGGGSKNFLMFSAYGNGNLGDRGMAELLGDFIETLGDIKVFAYSELDVAPYPFRPTQRLCASDLPLNMNVMSLFDGLILGGGGFLAWPHTPTWEPAWAHCIPIPYGILANGVGIPLPKELHSLVAGAAFATGRDTPSVQALATANAKAFRCPDPVIALYEGPGRKKTVGNGCAYILRGPVRDAHRELAHQVGPQDTVMGMEPGVDWPLIEIFPDIQFVLSFDKLAALISRHDTVVSERYHGCVMSLLSGKRSFAVCPPVPSLRKLRDLFDHLEIGDFVSETFEGLSNHDFPYKIVAEIIANIRVEFKYSVQRSLRRLCPNLPTTRDLRPLPKTPS